MTIEIFKSHGNNEARKAHFLGPRPQTRLDLGYIERWLKGYLNSFYILKSD